MKNSIKNIRFIFVLGFVALVFFSFSKEKENIINPIEIPELVQKTLEIKLNRYRNNLREKCIKKIYNDAELYVDSLVAEEFVDTISFPSRPIRPAFPEKIILNDSTGISPIIEY